MTWLKWTRIRSPGGRGNNVWLEGKTSESQVGCSFNRVGIDYHKTLQIPLVAGRAFATTDSINAPPVAIINQTLAQKLGEGNCWQAYRG